jgi:5-methylcytosine-specific restriction endonuclease McrA
MIINSYKEQFARTKAKNKAKVKRRKVTINSATTPNFLESYEWRKVRMQALIKFGSKCQCCGATPKTGAIIHVDHIKPRKTHPELALMLSNLQVLCHECNHGKGNWLTHDFR